MIILLLIFFSMEIPLHKLHLKGCVMYQVFVALEKLLSKRKGTLSTYACLHHWSDQRIWFNPIPTGGGHYGGMANGTTNHIVVSIGLRLGLPKFMSFLLSIFERFQKSIFRNFF